MAEGTWYRWEGMDLVLELRVQPRSKHESFGEIQGPYRRVRITAPPVDGQANKRLCRFLSKVFRVPQGDVSLCAGETKRDKRLRIHCPRYLPPEINPPRG